MKGYVGVDSEFIKKEKWKIEIKENVGNFSKVVQEKPSSENRGIKDRAKISRSKTDLRYVTQFLFCCLRNNVILENKRGSFFRQSLVSHDK